MRINVIIRYLNCSQLFNQYMNKATANINVKIYNNKIPKRLESINYNSFKQVHVIHTN